MTFTIKFNRTWAARRKHTKLRKQRQAYPLSAVCPAFNEGGIPTTGSNQDSYETDDANMSKTELGRPTLPKGTKLITFPIGHSVPSTQADSTSQVESHNAMSGPPG